MALFSSWNLDTIQFVELVYSGDNEPKQSFQQDLIYKTYLKFLANPIYKTYLEHGDADNTISIDF